MGRVIHRDRAEEREEQDISCQKQQLSRQELFRIDHAAEKARDERGKQNDHDAVETRDRTVDHRAVLAVDAPEIQRHEIAVLVVCRAAQRRHGKIQKDRRILAEDRKNALPVSRALILRAAAICSTGVISRTKNQMRIVEQPMATPLMMNASHR